MALKHHFAVGMIKKSTV